TFNGSPLVTAVGCAVLDTVLAPGFLAGVEAKGRYLAERLHELVTSLDLSHERGLGLLRALDLGADVAEAVVASGRDELAGPASWEGQGLVINTPRPNILRFMPALTVTHEEIDRMIDGVHIAITSVREMAGRRSRRAHSRLTHPASLPTSAWSGRGRRSPRSP